jgi:hypothetical protein
LRKGPAWVLPKTWNGQIPPMSTGTRALPFFSHYEYVIRRKSTGRNLPVDDCQSSPSRVKDFAYGSTTATADRRIVSSTPINRLRTDMALAIPSLEPFALQNMH